MKKIAAASAVIFVLFLTVSFVSAADKKYDVSFKNVPLKDFITFVAEFTGKNVIFNEADIRGNVTIDSQKEMDAGEILSVFYSILKMNGYIPVVSGNNIQIVPEKDIPAFDDPIVVNGSQPAQSYVTSVIPLAYYNAPTLLPILNRMKSRSGYVEAVRGLNIIVVRDQTTRINNMRALIDKLDTQANGYRFYNVPLKYAVASKVEQQIVKLYGELGKNALASTVPVVVSDDVSNSLIIAATDQEYERVKYLIENFDARSAVVNTAPRVFYLKNAKAEDVEKVLSKLVNSISPATQGNASAQQAGAVKANISSDKATNSIVAIGGQELYSNLESLIEKMDIPRRQVYVEALILETSLETGSRFGVEWFGGKDIKGGGVVVGGLTNSDSALGGFIGSVTGGSGTPALPSGFSLGVIGDLILFDGVKFPSIGALVSALRSISGVNIVSNPQILTLDNEEAEVFVGENRPYITSEKYDSNDNAIQTFDYRNVGIRLQVTPQISSNDMVTLTINQEVNKLSESTFNASAPVTMNRTTKTTVKLQDRSIIVISGLIKDDSTMSETGIPFLSKIPVLGWLFKNHSTKGEKTNLMVFITTSIIETLEDTKALMRVKEDAMKQFNRQAEEALGSRVLTDKNSNIEMQDRIEGSKEGYFEVDRPEMSPRSLVFPERGPEDNKIFEERAVEEIYEVPGGEVIIKEKTDSVYPGE